MTETNRTDRPALLADLIDATIREALRRRQERQVGAALDEAEQAGAGHAAASEAAE